MSRRSSELFFLRTVRVCASVGLGGAEPSSPGDALGKGVIFIGCRAVSGRGVCERASEGEAEREGTVISTSTFVYITVMAEGGIWRYEGENQRYRGVQSAGVHI